MANDHPKGFQNIETTTFEPSTNTSVSSEDSTDTLWSQYAGFCQKKHLMLLVLIPVLIALWYLFTLQSVRLEISPPKTELEVDSLFYFRLGDKLFVRAGQYDIRMSATGYQPLAARLQVSAGLDAPVSFRLEKQPGQLQLNSAPTGAEISLSDGTRLGYTPAVVTMPAGNQELLFTLPRYQSQKMQLEVIGLGRTQAVDLKLVPDWAEVEITSLPEQATVSVDQIEVGTTPGNFELLAGTRQLTLSRTDYAPFNTELDIKAGQHMSLPLIKLTLAKTKVQITSNPEDAAILIDGRYLGQTPLPAKLAPNTSYTMILQKSGYAPHEQSLEIGSQKEMQVDVALQAIEAVIFIRVTPEDSLVAIDGNNIGTGDMKVTLPATTHEILVEHSGYASYSAEVTPVPGAPTELNVQLLTEAVAARKALLKTYKNSVGQSFKLIKPGLVRMGGPRNEEGFQRDQKRRDVTLPDDFYIAATEVTNAQYRLFISTHSSGFEGQADLDLDNYPVVRVSWLAAIRYCNWLSEQERLEPVYVLADQQVSFLPKANGYRLPTEAEWAWVARQPNGQADPWKFPWGSTKSPREPIGNFGPRPADRMHILGAYTDGYLGTAPVGSFQPNPLGLFDLGGNVSEWINDYYHLDPVATYTGPATGTYRVIRGSSWKHNSVKELRLAFRQYDNEGQPDVGIRLARTPL